MRVRDFLAVEPPESVEGDLDRAVTGLAYDSRQVQPGQIFFAAPGEKSDGHDFIGDAVGRGAAAVVFSRPEARPQGCASVRVSDVRRALGLWGAHFYGHPSRALRLIGVTGTNGKTTLTYLLEVILGAAGFNPGVLGTINYRYCGKEIPSHHTTPESIDLHAMLASMRQAEVDAVAMEVSSHALAQQRVRGLDFDAGVFTNLSRDHLDYHRDMDDYFAAKSKLFTDYLNASTKTRKAAVIYGGDERGRQLIERLQRGPADLWSYGEQSHWDVHPLHVERDVAGLRGTIQARDQTIQFESTLIGAANLQNILGAVATARALGIPAGPIARGIRDLQAVPGRLEKILNDRGITVLVDYAHSPDALEKVLGAVRPLTRGRVFCVFGCGGDRDRGKRPVMGEIAARLSDVVVLTSDNPRTEDPLQILTELEQGVTRVHTYKLEPQASGAAGAFAKNGRGYLVEPDRRRAIHVALEAAAVGDLILIAGKGHEDYQILRTGKIHFDDREVVRAELRAAAQ